MGSGIEPLTSRFQAQYVKDQTTGIAYNRATTTLLQNQKVMENMLKHNYYFRYLTETDSNTAQSFSNSGSLHHPLVRLLLETGLIGLAWLKNLLDLHLFQRLNKLFLVILWHRMCGGTTLLFAFGKCPWRQLYCLLYGLVQQLVLTYMHKWRIRIYGCHRSISKISYEVGKIIIFPNRVRYF